MSKKIQYIGGKPVNPYRKTKKLSDSVKPVQELTKINTTVPNKKCTEDCYATYENIVINCSVNFCIPTTEETGKRIVIHSKECSSYRNEEFKVKDNIRESTRNASSGNQLRDSCWFDKVHDKWCQQRLRHVDKTEEERQRDLQEFLIHLQEYDPALAKELSRETKDVCG